MPGIVAGLPAVGLVVAGEDDSERRGTANPPVVEIRAIVGGELIGVTLHRAAAADGAEPAS